MATVLLTAWGVVVAVAHAARRAARPVGHAGHHPHHLARAGAAAGREPGHLPADHDHAVGAGRQGVRGFSMFGDSFVYVLFDDGVDLYWARSRVLEYLNQVQSRLPATARSALGPDATGVGWIYQYALVDRSGHGMIWPSCAPAGLVPALRAEDRARRGRGGQHRRHGAPVSDRARSRQTGRLPHHARMVIEAMAAPTRRRAARCSRWGKPSTWCAPAAICKTLDDFRASARHHRCRRLGAAGRRRPRADRARDAARHRRTRRRGRSRGRRHRHALGQERLATIKRSRPSWPN
jgi:hypothetical protein